MDTSLVEESDDIFFELDRLLKDDDFYGWDYSFPEDTDETAGILNDEETELNYWIHQLIHEGASSFNYVDLTEEEEETEEPVVDYEMLEGIQQSPQTNITRPASKSAVKELLELRVSKDRLKSFSVRCPICQDEFELTEDVKMMPCSHLYHTGCLIPWLELQNTCPSCRYELPTDDTVYENQNMDAMPQQDPNQNNIEEFINEFMDEG